MVDQGRIDMSMLKICCGSPEWPVTVSGEVAGNFGVQRLSSLSSAFAFFPVRLSYSLLAEQETEPVSVLCYGEPFFLSVRFGSC